MEIISWNINGLRRGFDELKQLIKTCDPDFVCLQKVRSNSNRKLFNIDGYHALYALVDSGNVSGVMTYAKIPAETVFSSRSIPERMMTVDLSEGGHLQIFDCKSFFLINAYVPFSNIMLAETINKRKIWDIKFRQCIVQLSTRKPIIICGDMNVVHTNKDTCEKRLTQNRGCFFEWERDNFNILLREADLVDTFRYLHPDKQAISYYGNFRSMQQGNRIDYFLMSRSILSGLNESEILTNFGTGQSVPIAISFNL